MQESLRDRLENNIPDLMTPSVIDLLEMIYVQKNESKGALKVRNFLNGLLDLQAEIASVQKRCKGVMKGDGLKFIDSLFYGFLSGGVTEYFNRSNDIAVLVFHRRGSDGYWDAVASFMPKIQIVFAKAALFNRCYKWAMAHTQLAAVRIDMCKNVVITEAPNHILGAEPCYPFRSLIPIRDSPIEIDKIDSVVKAIQYVGAEVCILLQGRIADLQRFCSVVSIGHRISLLNIWNRRLYLRQHTSSAASSLCLGIQRYLVPHIWLAASRLTGTHSCTLIF